MKADLHKDSMGMAHVVLYDDDWAFRRNYATTSEGAAVQHAIDEALFYQRQAQETLKQALATMEVRANEVAALTALQRTLADA